MAVISKRSRPAALTGTALALVLSISTPLIGKWEGLRTVPYIDIAGIPTVCYGDTHVEMRVYTKDECDAILRDRSAQFYQALSRCIDDAIEGDIPPRTAASVLSWSYNVGTGAACRSTLMKKLNAGDFRGACDELLVWNKARVNGVLQPVKGLTNRRKEEHALCVSGLTNPVASNSPSPNWVDRFVAWMKGLFT